MDSVAIRDPEDVRADGMEMLREMTERRDWDVAALPRLLETLVDQTYRLEMSLASHEGKEQQKIILSAINTTVGLMSEICE